MLFLIVKPILDTTKKKKLILYWFFFLFTSQHTLSTLYKKKKNKFIYYFCLELYNKINYALYFIKRLKGAYFVQFIFIIIIIIIYLYGFILFQFINIFWLFYFFNCIHTVFFLSYFPFAQLKKLIMSEKQRVYIYMYMQCCVRCVMWLLRRRRRRRVHWVK